MDSTKYKKIIDKKLLEFIKFVENVKSWNLTDLYLKKLSIKELIIDNFKIMIDIVHTLDEKAATFKAREYSDTIKALTEFDGNINTLSDAETILINYGKKNPTKTLKKIDEIIQTGKLTQVELAKKNPLIIAVNNLTKIYGIGYKKAKDLYNTHSILTINDLRNKFSIDYSILHGKQQLGLKYFDDLAIKIPRSEIEIYEQELLKYANHIDPNIKLSINGSYRRGQESSGDIDVLITSIKDVSALRLKFIEFLIHKNIIVDTLANGAKKFMGIIKLPPFTTYRHIDIIESTQESFPFGILYFTGSGGFNAKMRLEALHLGYSLNEYGFTHKTTKKPINKEDIIAKIGKDHFTTEEDIFQFLNMAYILPKDRININ